MRCIKAFVVDRPDNGISFETHVGAEVISINPDVKKLSAVVVHAMVDDTEPIIRFNLRVVQDGAEVRGRYVTSYRGYDLKFRHVFV